MRPIDHLVDWVVDALRYKKLHLRSWLPPDTATYARSFAEANNAFPSSGWIFGDFRFLLWSVPLACVLRFVFQACMQRFVFARCPVVKQMRASGAPAADIVRRVVAMGETCVYTLMYTFSSVIDVTLLLLNFGATLPWSDRVFNAMSYPRPWVAGSHGALDPSSTRLFRFYARYATTQYLSWMLSMPMEQRQRESRDRYIMPLHHLSALSLMFTSCAMQRYHAFYIVTLCHDICDIFLEGARLAHNLALQRTAIVVFALYAITFFLFRVYAYSWRIAAHYFWDLPAWTFDALDMSSSALQPVAYPGHDFFTLTLGAQACLNLYWSWPVARMFVRVLRDWRRVGEGRKRAVTQYGKFCHETTVTRNDPDLDELVDIRPRR